MAGKIVACKKVRQACARHLRDLKRQGTKAFPWVFDEHIGHRPIRYIEKFCVPSEGDFKRFILQPWDHFWIGSLYGWVHKRTRLRRFRYGLVFVARKQGKSKKISGLSLYGASKDGERGASVYLLANSEKQVREAIFDECKRMVDVSPLLAKHFRTTRDGVYHDKTFSKIRPLATDSKKQDGKNTHLGAFDELHEYKNYKLINVIKNSTGSRRQPLIIYITTAGYQLGGPLMEYYQKAADVLEGIIADERTFYYIAELDENDDFEDPSCWIKANPNLGVSVKLEDMVEEWHSAKDIPAERTDFLTKRLNMFIKSDEQAAWTWDVIKRNNGHRDLNELKGRIGVAGFDLSETEDFTSACIEIPLEDGYVFVFSHSWIPEAKVKADNEKLPYYEWRDAELLTICKGDYVKQDLVEQWIIAQAKLYGILVVAYDPANAFRLVKSLEAFGGEEWLKVVRQGALTLSPAFKDINELMLAGKVVFNENPLFRWYLANVRLKKDDKANWLPTKQDRYRKIDGFAAWLTAHVECIKLPPPAQGSGGVGFISVADLLKR